MEGCGKLLKLENPFKGSSGRMNDVTGSLLLDAAIGVNLLENPISDVDKVVLMVTR